MDSLDTLEQPSWASTVDVYIIINYTKILDIDTINQRFHAEVIIESKWFDPNIKSINDQIDEKKIWKPDLFIENGLIGREFREEITYRILNELVEVKTEESAEMRQEQRFMICEIRKVTGMFHENLELQDFPIDVQDLTINVGTKKPGNIVNFITMQDRQKTMRISNTLDKSMWKLHRLLLTKMDKIYREYSFGSRVYPSVKVSAKAFRLPAFFYWNVILPIVLVTFASLAPFVIDIRISQSRLTSTCTLMLTSVGIRWTIVRLLPTVSYLTSLDKYSLASMFIITMELLYHATMGAFFTKLPEDLSYSIDKGFFVFFCFLILFKQLLFFVWVMRIKVYRRKVAEGKIIKLNDEIIRSESSFTMLFDKVPV